MARSGILGAAFAPRYVAETTTKAQNFAGVFVQQGINTGTSSKTLDALTGTGTGTLLIQGTSSKTLADLTGSATGTLLIQGSSSKTLDDLVGAGSSTLLIRGTSSATLADVTATATGVLPIAGVEARTLDDLTGSATATLRIGAAGDATLDDLVGTAAATLLIRGSSSVTLDDLTASAAAMLATVVLQAGGRGGTSRRRRHRREIEIIAKLRVRRSPRVKADGETSAPPEGDLRASIAIPLRLHGRGVVGTAGRGTLAMPAPALTARVFLVPCGDARFVLRPTVRARARHEHFTEEEIETLLLVA